MFHRLRWILYRLRQIFTPSHSSPPLPPLPPSPRVSHLSSLLSTTSTIAPVPLSHSHTESNIDPYLLGTSTDAIKAATQNMLAVRESKSDTRMESLPKTSTRSTSDEGDRRPRVSTIYPDDQGANRNPPLEAELQRSYTNPYVIPSSLADQKCGAFGIHGLLDELNDIMGTSYPLSPSLELHLARCISLNYDFGLAYSYLRPEWRPNPDFDTLAARRDEAESRDAALCRDALDSSKQLITDPYRSPRRIWDLYSNRVIPYHW